MTISQYLKIRGIKAVQFAGMVKTSKGCVSRWIAGRGVPSGIMLERIFHVTGGLVMPNDFFDFSRDDSPGDRQEAAE